MPRLSNITDEKPAAATDHGGLEFVWTTTAPSHERDDNDVNVHHFTVPLKSC